MKRNCSITPRQLGLVFFSLCSVSSLISFFFLIQGAPYVAAFAGLELLAVGAAMIAFARRTGDYEQLTLTGRSLVVEQTISGRAQHASWATDWLRIEPKAGQGSLVQLSGQGQTLHVGRFLRPELRSDFAQELRQALRQAHNSSAPGHPEH